MFNSEAIEMKQNGGCTCAAICTDRAAADKIRSGFTGPVRQINMFADLYCEKNRLIIEAPTMDIMLKIIDILNHSVEWEE